MRGHVSNKVAIVFIALTFAFALALVSIPTGYYISIPGKVYNTSTLVSSNAGSPNTGVLYFTTVDTRLNIIGPFFTNRPKIDANPIMLSLSYFDGDARRTPLTNYLGTTNNQAQYRRIERAKSDEAELVPVAAALHYLGREVEYSGKGVSVLGFSDERGANSSMKEGDVIVALNGKPVHTYDELKAELAKKPAKLALSLSDGRVIDRSGSNGSIGILASTFMPYLETNESISVNLSGFDGGSAGLMLALDIISRLENRDLTNGKIIAGTGGIAPDGKVTPVVGAGLKVVAAHKAGASVFFVPQENYEEAAMREFEGMKILPVERLEDACKEVGC